MPKTTAGVTESIQGLEKKQKDLIWPTFFLWMKGRQRDNTHYEIDER